MCLQGKTFKSPAKPHTAQQDRPLANPVSMCNGETAQVRPKAKARRRKKDAHTMGATKSKPGRLVVADGVAEIDVKAYQKRTDLQVMLP